MKTTKILPPDNPFDVAMNMAPNVPSSVRPSHEYSIMQWGLIVLVVALVLGVTPWFLGLGWQWTGVLALAAGALWQSERGKMTLPSWFTPLFVLVICAQALRVLDIALIPFLWVASAALLCRGVWVKSKSEPNGWSHRLKLGSLWHGHHVWITLGCALSLLSLAQTWGETEGWWSYGWMGGLQSTMQYETHFSSASGQWEGGWQPTMTYNPTMFMNNYFYPGIAYSGRWQPQATWAIVALLFVLCWSMLQRDDAGFQRGGAWAVGALVFAALWWFGLRNDAPGPRWFLVGLLMSAFGVWKLRSGEDSGAHDPKSLLDNAKMYIKKS